MLIYVNFNQWNVLNLRASMEMIRVEIDLIKDLSQNSYHF